MIFFNEVSFLSTHLNKIFVCVFLSCFFFGIFCVVDACFFSAILACAWRAFPVPPALRACILGGLSRVQPVRRSNPFHRARG